MKKTNNNKGFSMSEMLITVAILAILAGLAVVGVIQYRKSMHHLEMDSIAKELFITAQNHLSMSEGQGYYDIDNTSAFGTQDSNTGVYYFIVDGETDLDEDTVLGRMFPPGSIDFTVISSGNFIIRYQRSPAMVLDVFYASKGGERYGHTFVSTTDYQTALDLRDTDSVNNKSRRRDCFGNDHAVMGWYGGDDLASGAVLKSPKIEVKNEERLLVEVTDNITGVSGYKLQLVVTGKSSNNVVKTFNLNADSGEREVHRITKDGNKYTVVLDDIGTNVNMHFAELTDNTGAKSFSPGETISIQAKAFSTTALTNVATSEMRMTNSLFDSATAVSGTDAKPVISNIRHLENLSGPISNFGSKVMASDAVQTADLFWTGSKGFRDAYVAKYSVTPEIISLANNKNVSFFRPVQLIQTNAITYDGGYHSINGIPIDETTTVTDKSSNAGLFAVLPSGSIVRNLELVEFSVKGTASAGALAGKADGATVTNVLARNYTSGEQTSSATGIQASASPGNAGGLIGQMNGGTVTNCAAALIVSGNGSAGGLIGTANSTITACYSGGHTVSGTAAYDPVNYNVTANNASGIAGGLIGVATGASIDYSYSTCSVSGATAGGFVGKGGTISNSYCTGLVYNKKAEKEDDVDKNAFIGDDSGSVNNTNTYYQIVNEVMLYNDRDEVTGVVYKQSGAGLKAFDADADTFDNFVVKTVSDGNGGTVPVPKIPAKPYDPILDVYYGHEYFLRSISELGATVPVNYYVNTHYGDWPAPEIFVINTQ